MTTVLILNPTDHWQQEENQCVVTPDVSSHGKIDVQSLPPKCNKNVRTRDNDIEATQKCDHSILFEHPFKKNKSKTTF